MSLAPTIRVSLSVESGRVRRVALGSQAPSPAQALFVGLFAREVPARAKLVFSLCPVAQSVAAELAIGAARGAPPQLDRKRQLALACEHLAENMRSLVLAWPGVQPDTGTLANLRTGLEALRNLPDAADIDLQRRILELRNAAVALGFGDDHDAERWFPRLLRSTVQDPLLGLRAIPGPTALRPEDDEGAFASLGLAMPAAWRLEAPVPIPEHLFTRGAGIPAMIDRLTAIAAGESADGSARAQCLGANKGAAAVNSPRGRLFHYVELDDADRVLAYRTLSPTDRNFACGGPFERALLASDMSAGAAAEQTVARIAALYDPCVAVEVKISESADA